MRTVVINDVLRTVDRPSTPRFDELVDSYTALEEQLREVKRDLRLELLRVQGQCHHTWEEEKGYYGDYGPWGSIENTELHWGIDVVLGRYCSSCTKCLKRYVFDRGSEFSWSYETDIRCVCCFGTMQLIDISLQPVSVMHPLKNQHVQYDVKRVCLSCGHFCLEEVGGRVT